MLSGVDQPLSTSSFFSPLPEDDRVFSVFFAGDIIKKVASWAFEDSTEIRF
jgi:hypothetical protein